MNHFQPEPDDTTPPKVIALWEVCVIGFLLGIILMAAWKIWANEAAGQGPIPQAQQLRDTCYLGDDYRNVQVIWSRGDPTDPQSIGLIRAGDTGDLESVSLRATDGTMFITKAVPLRERTQFESWHWKAFRANAPVGKYTIVIAGRDKGELTVKQSPAFFTTKLSPGERTNSLTAKTNEVVRGYGCVMTGNLTVQAGATIIGLTIDGNVTGSFDNVVFDSCTFRRGMVGPMGEADRGCLFRDCRFENATAATCSSGCFLRCRWECSAALGGHNFCNERSSRLCVINCTFRQTDRGLILRSRWGPNSDNLYAGLQFTEINQTPNGGELFCVEGSGSGFNRNLIFGVRQNGSVGGVSLFDSIASDNLFNNCRIPFDLCGLNEQKNNIISDSEVDYVHINWPRGDGTNYSGASGTLLSNVACVGFRPSARGQPSADPKYYLPGLFRAVIEDGSPTPSTRGIGLTVRDQGEGFEKIRGVKQ